MVHVSLSGLADETAGVNRPTCPRRDSASDSGDQYPDYTERLRAACRGASGLALIAREDALGAAAEIEQLWVALRFLTGWK